MAAAPHGDRQPAVAPNLTAAMTSATPAQRAISGGAAIDGAVPDAPVLLVSRDRRPTISPRNAAASSSSASTVVLTRSVWHVRPPSSKPVRVVVEPRCRRRATRTPVAAGSRATRRAAARRRSGARCAGPGTRVDQQPHHRRGDSLSAVGRRRPDVDEVGVADAVREQSSHADDAVAVTGDGDVLRLLEGALERVEATGRCRSRRQPGRPSPAPSRSRRASRRSGRSCAHSRSPSISSTARSGPGRAANSAWSACAASR